MTELSSGDPAFIPFPKLPRFFRDTIVTEKIDGTNAAVIVVSEGTYRGDLDPSSYVVAPDGSAVLAQSRKRIISPGKATDNFGFAAWVHEHAAELAGLGVGHHYGEWWGQGIQRGYGLEEKRFSLFNPDYDLSGVPAGLVHTVPVLVASHDPAAAVRAGLQILRTDGSYAAAGFEDPEGVVAYHTASGRMFKATLEGDAQPKSIARDTEAVQ
jgi:hypothetical protein